MDIHKDDNEKFFFGVDSCQVDSKAGIDGYNKLNLTINVYGDNSSGVNFLTAINKLINIISNTQVVINHESIKKINVNTVKAKHCNN